MNVQTNIQLAPNLVRGINSSPDIQSKGETSPIP